jgi:hypothetical protein
MSGDGAPEALSFVGRTISPTFVVHSVTIASGRELAYEPGDWADAVVVLEEGELELECCGGTCRRFQRGAVLTFDSLPLRTLRSIGAEPALLIGVSRRRSTDESTADSTSHQ